MQFAQYQMQVQSTIKQLKTQQTPEEAETDFRLSTLNQILKQKDQNTAKEQTENHLQPEALYKSNSESEELDPLASSKELNH